MIIRIDAHQHFWKLDRGDYEWLAPDDGVIYQDFLPEDLYPHLKEHGIDHSIVVQAAPTVDETEFLLRLYNQYESIAGVVGWLDLDSAMFRSQFHRLRQHQGFVGIRTMLQDLDDDRWILRPQVMENIKIIIEKDFPLDLLILPRHLNYVIELLNKYPTLRAAVNHAAKPSIKDHVLEPWKEQIREIASFRNVMCKLSGLITEADHSKWKPEHLEPFVNHVVHVFGADSVMFGSDWPVCLKAGNYGDVYHAIQSILNKATTDHEREQIFGQNAVRFYKRLRLNKG